MLCKKCGNELKMGAKFCYNCGYYVDEEEEVEETEGSKKKKKKKNDGEPKLSFKERREKRKEEKLLAKEAKLRQKEIEAEEKERQKMAAEYEKEQKIKEHYEKENENKLIAEKKARELEEKARQQELERQKELERQRILDEKFKEDKVKFDEELNKKFDFSSTSNSMSSNHENNRDKHHVSHSNMKNYDDENENFSYGTEDIITRSPGLGFEESKASHHVKDEKELSFDDFNVENRYKKIENEVKSNAANNKSAIDLSYEEYKPTKNKKKKKNTVSRYLAIILPSVLTFVVIFTLVYFITNNLNNNNPKPTDPSIYEDRTVILSNCTVLLPGNLSYNVEGNYLYVAYDTYNVSFTVSKDNYENYSNDLTKLSRDFEKRKYTVSSSDKREINGYEFLIYKLIVNGSSKYFYLTKVNSSNIAMGMLEMKGASTVDTALQSVSKIVSTVNM